MSSTVKYLIAVAIYGSIGYILNFVQAQSEFVVLCRGTIGSLFIFLVILLRRKKSDLSVIRKHLLLLVISGMALGLNWIFLFEGYRHAVSLASLCNYTAPVMVVIITAVFFKEKLNVTQVVCVFFSFLGIVLLSGILGSSTGDSAAVFYGLLAAIGFVVLVLCNRRFAGIDPLEKTLVQLTVSALTVLPFVIINRSFPVSLDTASLLLVIMLGVLHTGVAYILYFSALADLEPVKIAVIGYVEPVLAVLSGALLLNERVDVYTVIGAVLIIGSALISELSNIRK